MVDGLLHFDTTSGHHSHIFDLNCRICMKKNKCEQKTMRTPSSEKLEQEIEVVVCYFTQFFFLIFNFLIFLNFLKLIALLIISS